MNQFKKVPDFAAASIGNSDSSFLHAHLKILCLKTWNDFGSSFTRCLTRP
ncbi:hypothetical protein RND71_035291 [Anisodus tanguticus]|uniref:Uncharacterized protein n=1 Tax=Anisodus tanguticus TaxID=243964 RepID=A0AAE1V228_9SOLA|nr:hypothetical protein RND71_035291 [Anisodus tanguticus]